jgi:hypothetical protein
MHTKNLLLSSLIIFLVNATIAGELNTTLPSGYLKKEPAEKEIWYSGLVTKAIIFYGQSCANGESKGCFNLGLIYDTGEPTVQDMNRPGFTRHFLAYKFRPTRGCHECEAIYRGISN